MFLLPSIVIFCYSRIPLLCLKTNWNFKSRVKLCFPASKLILLRVKSRQKREAKCGIRSYRSRRGNEAMNHVRKWSNTLQIAPGRCCFRQKVCAFPSSLVSRWVCYVITGEIASPTHLLAGILRRAYRTRSRRNCWHFRVLSLGSRDEESWRRMAGTLCKTWTAFELTPIHFATRNSRMHQ